MLPRVLCVDDEAHVLTGLSRQLRRRFAVTTAESGAAALAIVAEQPAFAVVVSDMRMPHMNGATFLRHVREASPDTTRVLLTGHTDFDAAMAAVNEGNIFRFLTKPCPSEILVSVLDDGVERHRQAVSTYEEYERLVAELRETEQHKAEFLANISHELRTPLNVILGYSDLLGEHARGTSEEENAILDRMQASSRQICDVLESIVQAGSLFGDQAPVELTRVPLAAVIQALKAAATIVAQPSEVGLAWETPAVPSGSLVTHRVTLALVMRHLLSNAFKFTPAGTVIVRVQPSAPTLVLEVSDTGIGVRRDSLPVIFDALRQGDGSSTRRYDGLGLGLYLVRENVRSLGGTIEVESQLGVGSTFRVTLPGYEADGAGQERIADGERVP